jgi:hypothetical protein
VVVDGTGNLYVADSGNYTIRKVATDGTVSTLAGLAGSFGGTDGTGSAARFFEPQALTLDADGNLYVGDTLAVRRITPGGVVTTLAGGVGIDDQADGTGAAAQFVYANAITYDGVSTLYVCDSSTIRKVTLGGAGPWGRSGRFYGGIAKGAASVQPAYPLTVSCWVHLYGYPDGIPTSYTRLVCRPVNGYSNPYLSFTLTIDNNGLIDATDLAAFGGRFGFTI